jgi:transmembrane sensor
VPQDRPLRPDAIEAAAADWLVKHDRGLKPAEQDGFLQWLAAAPEHRESFNRHRQMWNEFNLLAQWRPEHSAEPNPDLLARPRRRRCTLWLVPTLLAAAAGVALIWAWSPFADGHPRVATAVFAEESYRQQALADGSLVDLNRGAHVLVQFSAAERRVLLLQGEAQFSVAEEVARPFVVRAGAVDVRAVGTAFHVKLTGGTVEVLVTEGKVQVAQQSATYEATTAAPPAIGPVMIELRAGQRTIVPAAAVVAPLPVMAATTEEIERLLAWQPRLLDFNSTPLAEVVVEFNRRNRTQVVIGDDELRRLPIVASIRSDNIEGFVRLLEATLEVRAERSSGEIVLRRKR